MWHERLRDTVQTKLEPDMWVGRHGDYLFRYAFMRLRDRALSEDLVQETFVGALRNADQFVGKSSERTWLVGILKRKIVDHLRAAYRHSRPSESEDAFFDAVGHCNFSSQMEPGNWGTDPATLFDQAEFRRILALCLEEMPPRLAQVFVLRELDQMDSTEICRRLGISTSNLWVMLHRARMQLRENLESRWFGRKPLVAYAQVQHS